MPRGKPWTPAELAKLRRYAERGLSARETAILMGRTQAAISQIASSLGVNFHGPSGAPEGNQNRLGGPNACPQG